MSCRHFQTCLYRPRQCVPNCPSPPYFPTKMRLEFLAYYPWPLIPPFFTYSLYVKLIMSANFEAPHYAVFYILPFPLCLTFNPPNTKLNPICHFLALLGNHPILHVSRIRVNLLNAELHPTYHLLALLEAHHIFHVSRIRVKSLLV